MAKYQKREKTRVLCKCGCKRMAEGNASRQYYEPYCRVKAYVARHQKDVA